jgi:hypothetical protein
MTHETGLGFGPLWSSINTVMSVSLVIGFVWVRIYHLLATSWFFSRFGHFLLVGQE